MSSIGTAAMPSPSNSRSLFHELDGLRGIAALAVVLFHYGVYFETFHLSGSYLAVDMFFALSGFVLAFSYESRFQQGLSSLHFMKMRLVRLYPLYFLGVLMGCLSLLFSAGAPANLYDSVGSLLIALISALLFLPTWLDGAEPFRHLFPLNWPAWSLFFELMVNLLYALLARHLTNRRLIAILAIATLALLGSAYRYHGLDAGVYLSDWDAGLARVIFSFFAGVAIYRIRAAHIFHWVRLPLWICGLLLLAIFAFEPSRMRGLYDFVVTLILFPGIILALTQEEASRWVPLLKRLGEISYAIYILHFPVIALVRAYFYTPGMAPPLWPVGLGTLAASLLLAFVAHHYYDAPVRRWLSRRLSR